MHFDACGQHLSWTTLPKDYFKNNKIPGHQYVQMSGLDIQAQTDKGATLGDLIEMIMILIPICLLFSAELLLYICKLQK